MIRRWIKRKFTMSRPNHTVYSLEMVITFLTQRYKRRKTGNISTMTRRFVVSVTLYGNLLILIIKHGAKLIDYWPKRNKIISIPANTWRMVKNHHVFWCTIQAKNWWLITWKITGKSRLKLV